MQGVAVEHIVVVQKSQPVAIRQREALVGVARDALVFRQLFVGDAPVLCSITPGHRAHIGVGLVRGVGQHQLPVLVALAGHALDHLLQKGQRSVIKGHHHADLRPAGHALGPLTLEHAAGGQVRPVLPGIPVQRQIHPEADLPPQGLAALLFGHLGAPGGQLLHMGRVQQALRHAAHAVLLGNVRGQGLVVVLLCHFAHSF